MCWANDVDAGGRASRCGRRPRRPGGRLDGARLPRAASPPSRPARRRTSSAASKGEVLRPLRRRRGARRRSPGRSAHEGRKRWGATAILGAGRRRCARTPAPRGSRWLPESARAPAHAATAAAGETPRSARAAFPAIASMSSGQASRGRSWPMPPTISRFAPGIARAVARPPDGRDEPVGAAVDDERRRRDAAQRVGAASRTRRSRRADARSRRVDAPVVGAARASRAAPRSSRSKPGEPTSRRR